jgi:uncharacterized protein YdcH (DUF465 family)|tara:strand:+ start:339 stop:491 length:153 start_codon:yes stop_codon:yes gene_type:complete
MVSNRELENVVSQVNAKFEELFNKLAQLEKQIADNVGATDGNAKKGKSKG